MTRPGLCASRSSTVHRTDTPVATSVTVTTVPKAKLGLAQVPAGEPYHDASPLTLSEGGAGAGVETGLGAAATDDGATAGWAGGAGGGGGAVGVVVGGT